MKEQKRSVPAQLPRVELRRDWGITLGVLVGLGAVAVLVGLAIDPQRAGGNFLLSLFFLLGLGLAGLLFIALVAISSGSWAVVLRRIPEAMAATLPVCMVLSIGLFALIPFLYEWSHAEAVASDELLAHKSAWLNTTSFIVRTLICSALWLLFAHLLVGRSRRRDIESSASEGGVSIGLPALFVVLFAITFSVVSFDWVMSLEPHWFSTIFAVYNFAGLFLSGLAAITLLVIVLRRLGPLRDLVTVDHLHDLAKLLLGFSVFWAYIWFSQFMLIWYGNIPEESSYFHLRQRGSWEVLFVLNIFVNWIIPFLVLLPRTSKRNETVLLNVCLLLIAGRWLDLYLMVLPPLVGDEPKFGFYEALPFAGAVALFLLVAFRSLGKFNIIPVRDPLLEESLHHHQ